MARPPDNAPRRSSANAPTAAARPCGKTATWISLLEDVKGKFGALFNAFSYGTPPHAGAAPGLDRIIMLLAKEDNIREVIAFPKNKKARDVMMNAPSKVLDKQLEEVHIKLNLENNK